ncbi:glycosyltransferase family 39 protein [Nocardia sp. NPDC004722]
MTQAHNGFASVPTLSVAAVTAVVLLARCARYDYFGDELYFVSAGRHLAAGYVDQGPLVPALARAADLLAPGSLPVLRFAAISAGIAAIVTTAATARELGGGRIAQTGAALTYATCPFLIVQTASLSTFAFDTSLSAAAIWLLIRWTRTRRDRLLLAAALAVALDIQVKLLVAVLLVGLGVGILAAGPRTLVRRPAAWAGFGIIALSAAPSLWWQYRHGWPQLAMGAVIGTEQRLATGGVAGLPLQLVLLAGLLGVPLALTGLWALATATRWRAYRFVAVATAVDIAFVVAADGRPYYATAYFPVLFAAGATCLADRAARSRATAAGFTAGAAMSTVLAIAVVSALPLPGPHRPTDTRAELSTRLRMFGTSGWDHLITTVDAIYRTLPPDQRPHTVVIAENYWQAAALDVLPTAPLPVYSPNRGFALFATPTETATSALYVTGEASEFLVRRAFTTAYPLARLDDPLGFPGIDRRVTIWRCDHPRRPWPALWAESTTNTFDPGL